VSEDRREQAFWIGPGESERIRVTDSSRLDLNQYLAFPGSIELDGLDAEWLAGFMCHGGARFHGH
jgi:hypothetical protein